MSVPNATWVRSAPLMRTGTARGWVIAAMATTLAAADGLSLGGRWEIAENK